MSVRSLSLAQASSTALRIDLAHQLIYVDIHLVKDVSGPLVDPDLNFLVFKLTYARSLNLLCELDELAKAVDGQLLNFGAEFHLHVYSHLLGVLSF